MRFFIIIQPDRESVYMTNRDWLPSLWGEQKGEAENPFSALRNQIDTVFEDFGRGWPALEGEFAVRSNVSETDKEVRITAELPGIDKKDIDISVTDNRITIRGEKKSEKEEKKEEEGRQFLRVERSSGSFQRSTSLPFEIDPDAVKADFKDGVLTVTIAKPPEAAEKSKKIEIRKSD